MMEINSLESLRREFIGLERILRQLLREEGLLENSVLSKRGFLIKRYSLKYDALNKKSLITLKAEIQNIIAVENSAKTYLKKNLGELKRCEVDYRASLSRPLGIDQLVHQFNDACYLSRLLSVRADDLIKIVEENKMHTKNADAEIKKIILSFERMTTQIMKFIDFVSQICAKIASYRKMDYYETPRTYGRAMNLQEFKRTIEIGVLSASKSPTPVFDSPASVMQKIARMSSDERKNFFRLIGVEGGNRVVFFRTRLKPINHERPISQTNGLRAYMFHKGIKVDILKSA